MPSMYCQSLPWYYSVGWRESGCKVPAFIVQLQSDSPDIQVRAESSRFQLLKLNSPMCVGKWYFFHRYNKFQHIFRCQQECWAEGRGNAKLEAPAARLGNAGIAGTSKALITDETYFCLFCLIFDSSCIILKRKKSSYVCLF